jgi:hypothetical protein
VSALHNLALMYAEQGELAQAKQLLHKVGWARLGAARRGAAGWLGAHG